MPKPSARDYHLRRTYGITLAQYNELLAKQDSKCAVCKRPSSIFKVNLAVDHDHKTGRIRGLLCIHCNRYVIGRHRDPELFHSASQYLRQGTDHYVPDRPKKKKKRRSRKRK